MLGRERGSGRLARAALRVAGSVLRWAVVAALSLFYYVTSAMLVFFGGLLAWNGLGPGFERDPGAAHPVAGVVLVALGALVFVFFPRLVKRLTGREIISTPYGGFGARGDG